ncbi:MAG: acylphosphatase [Alphaproteobacteria bacterium]|nr:MAG: acylphosphatase [Alphaproteobacteria bacterium]
MTAHGPQPQIAVRVRISGRVQGVWFRAWTVEQAAALGLKGFVRNRLDGTVEALFAGPEPAVRAMIDRCHQGPPRAQVLHVEESPAAGLVPDRFEQKPTV